MEKYYKDKAPCFKDTSTIRQMITAIYLKKQGAESNHEKAKNKYLFLK